MRAPRLRAFLDRPVTRESVRRGIDRLLDSPVFRSRLFLWTAATILVAFSLFQTAQFIFVWDIDSSSYYTGAKGFLRGVDIYDPAVFQATADSLFGHAMVIPPYIYPPLLGQILSPLAVFSPETFYWAFFFLNIALAALALVLIARLLGLETRPNVLPVLFLFLLLPTNRPLISTFYHGQINFLVLDALLAGLLLRRKNRPWLSGLFLGFAIIVKIYPALFVLPLLWAKKWRQLAALAAGGAVLVAASVAAFGASPWAAFLRFTAETMTGRSTSPFLVEFGTAVLNVSVKGFLSHLFEAFAWNQAGVGPLWAVLVAGLLLFALARLRRTAWTTDLGLQAAALLPLTVLLAPLSWSHHYIVVLVPLAYLFRLILAERRYGAFLGIALFGSLALYAISWKGFPFNHARTFGGLGLLLLVLLLAPRTAPPVRDE